MPLTVSRIHHHRPRLGPRLLFSIFSILSRILPPPASPLSLSFFFFFSSSVLLLLSMLGIGRTCLSYLGFRSVVARGFGKGCSNLFCLLLSLLWGILGSFFFSNLVSNQELFSFSSSSLVVSFDLVELIFWNHRENHHHHHHHTNIGIPGMFLFSSLLLLFRLVGGCWLLLLVGKAGSRKKWGSTWGSKSCSKSF